MDLRQKIEKRRAKVAVIGIGYVGLPLSVEIARAGFECVGIDVDKRKVDSVCKGRSFIEDVPSRAIKEVTGSGKCSATTD